MISPISSFSPFPVLPTPRIRGASLPDNEELRKSLRETEDRSVSAARGGALGSSAYMIPLPQADARTAVPDATMGGRGPRYARADAAEAQNASSDDAVPGLVRFGLPNLDAARPTLASVQPVQVPLDSAAFVSLYSSNDAFPAIDAEQRAARPFQQASRALISSFSFGEDSVLSLAA